MSDHTQALLDKLDAWLLEQPEYPFLFLADRRTRRRAAQLVGHHVFTLPTRKPGQFAASRLWTPGKDAPRGA